MQLNSKCTSMPVSAALCSASPLFSRCNDWHQMLPPHPAHFIAHTGPLADRRLVSAPCLSAKYEIELCPRCIPDVSFPHGLSRQPRTDGPPWPRTFKMSLLLEMLFLSPYAPKKNIWFHVASFLSSRLSGQVEMKMKKTEAIRWESLEGEGQESNIKHFDPNEYPTSSQHSRKWDKIVVDISEEEKNEKLEGDAALNKVFQQIYTDGSDEIRRAMNKSFTESHGTVLSTNWKDVGKRKVDPSPPDDVELRKY
ncbi:protein SGT1 homolog [Nerophis ophidion]|uniref:protein SGT1 homolog n=1 Tax=Nerophis ophidion TaxID=159077 RepID=UPI002ADF6376|nr:protein SGT1 homolog [Nerophis ophidion]